MPESGPCWFTPTLEEDLGCFVQDVPRVFFIDDLIAAVADGTKAYQVVLETRYDVSALNKKGRKLEVAGS